MASHQLFLVYSTYMLFLSQWTIFVVLGWLGHPPDIGGTSTPPGLGLLRLNDNLVSYKKENVSRVENTPSFTKLSKRLGAKNSFDIVLIQFFGI